MIAGPRVRLDDRQSFQKLKTVLHRRVVEAIDVARLPALGEQGLREILRALAAHVCAAELGELPLDAAERMVLEILDEIDGFGPLEPLLADPTVSDIFVNGPDNVRVERNGLLEATEIRFADEAHLLRLIRRLVEEAGARIDERSPSVDVKLPDGARLTAVIPPLAVHGPTLCLRRAARNALRLEELVRRGSLAAEMSEFLVAAVRGRLNMVISGGSGSGKTTLLNNLARVIPRQQRIVTIEETAELSLPQPDVVSLQTRGVNLGAVGQATPREVLRSALRLRPDRILLGDARGGEVLDLLEAMNTGHDGSMSTLHANDTRDALDRIELLTALSGVDLPLPAARGYIASAIQILIHVGRLASGERKVLRISELCGVSGGQFQIEDLFVYRMAGCDEAGRVQGSFYSTGTEPVALARLAAVGVELPRDLFLARELNVAGQYAAKG